MRRAVGRTAVLVCGISIALGTGCAPKMPRPIASTGPGVHLRTQTGSNWVTPVKNQWSTGNCLFFSSVGVIESMYKITRGDPTDLWNCSYAGSGNLPHGPL